MQVDSHLLRQLLFGGRQDERVRELLKALIAEDADSNRATPLLSSATAIIERWEIAAIERASSTPELKIYSQVANASRRLTDELSGFPIPMVELRTYIEALYSQDPQIGGSGPDSMMRSVLESYLSDPGAVRRPRTADPADIWPLLIDIALRKLSDRRKSFDTATSKRRSRAKEAAEFVTLLKKLCKTLWSKLKTGDERLFAGLCLQRKSLDEISAISKKASEVIDVHLQQLRNHIGQLALAGGD